MLDIQSNIVGLTDIKGDDAPLSHQRADNIMAIAY